MSGPASASASPGPSGPSYLDLYNQHDVPKPFKRVPTFSNSSTGRRRNYKQIIAFEQEAQFELGGGVSKRRNKKKKTTTTGAAGGVSGSATPQLSADGTRQLMGAAAKAAKKREERLKREQAAQEAAARSEAVSMDGTPVPEGGANEPAKEGEDGLDPDTTMKTEAGEEVLTEAQLAQQKADEQERLRKMNLPTYLSVEAPPSLRPAKKYCDITGLIAPYTDPKTGLRYHSAEIYEVIKTFGPGVDQAYLGLRGRNQTLM